MNSPEFDDPRNLSLEADTKIQQWSEKILREKNPCYVLGRNAWAESLIQNANIIGVVDDYTKEAEFLGVPVIRMSQLPGQALVISTVLAARPQTAVNRLRELGFTAIDYLTIAKHSGVLLVPDFLIEFQHEFIRHRSFYESLYQNLSDEISKQTLEDIVNFRRFLNLQYLESFTFCPNKQYFEEFLQLQTEGEVFVDVGCFDGMTTQIFVEKYPDYRRIHVLEPHAANMATVRSALEGIRDISFHEIGAADLNTAARLTTAGSASAVSESGDCPIELRRLDDCDLGPVTYLKMDIEGFEIPALEGARSLILQHHPRLAICVYHKPDDLRKIALLVLSIRKDYDLYLRHYTEGTTETVMYFVPNSNRVNPLNS